MQANQKDNIRIAKNSLMLYARMFLMLVISLYTSRVILRVLGIVDYGIYNVVSGIVTMFTFVMGMLVATTQRYISYYLGKGDGAMLNKIWSVCMNIHILFAILILVAAETIGVWFFMNKMVIPEERMIAAMWVYHLSIISTMISIISIPYNATIVAHESMGAFATLSIVETILKLLIVFALYFLPFDKLIVYSILLLLVSASMRFFYASYCKRNYEETHYHYYNDIPLAKELLSFVGWNIFGSMSGAMNTQGLNILLNMFFGPVINAARGVAVQVQGVVTQFAGNFQMALNPQIIKTYAAGEMEEMHSLVFRSTKFSFVLLFVLCLPIIIESHWILDKWLGIIPEYTETFLRIILCITILDSMANPLVTSATATGRIKKYQIIVGGIYLLVLPVAYMVLKAGGCPWTVFVVYFIGCVVAFMVRLIIVKQMIKLSVREYFRKSILPCLLIICLSIPIPIFLHRTLGDGTFNSIINIVISILLVAISSFLVGLTKSERRFVMNEGVKLLRK